MVCCGTIFQTGIGSARFLTRPVRGMVSYFELSTSSHGLDPFCLYVLNLSYHMDVNNYEIYQRCTDIAHEKKYKLRDIYLISRDISEVM